jgi:hypothetical protein
MSSIRGLEYNGDGDLIRLHATIYCVPPRGWRCEVLEEAADRSRAEAYTYGETAGLTLKMAQEIASRFVTGRKIPKRLEWR